MKLAALSPAPVDARPELLQELGPRPRRRAALQGHQGLGARRQLQGVDPLVLALEARGHDLPAGSVVVRLQQVSRGRRLLLRGLGEASEGGEGVERRLRRRPRLVVLLGPRVGKVVERRRAHLLQDLGRKRVRNSQLWRLISRSFSTRFGSFLDERSSLGTSSKRGCFLLGNRFENTHVEATLNHPFPALILTIVWIATSL